MKKLIIAVTFALSACGVVADETIVTESHGQRSDRLVNDGGGPNVCVMSCGSTPDVEPLGQICHLISDTCVNGIRFCSYSCQPVDPEPAPKIDPRRPPKNRAYDAYEKR